MEILDEGNKLSGQITTRAEGFKVKAGRAEGDPLLVQGRLFGLVAQDA